jgi:hypothetical protein
MSYEEAAMAGLLDGVHEGDNTSLSEAPHVKPGLGFNPSDDVLRNMQTEVGPLPEPSTLGVTYIPPNGKAVTKRINSYMAKAGAEAGRIYRKSEDWVYSKVRRLASLVTQHENMHVLSGHLARGEEIDERARNLMESITTYGLHKLKTLLGKYEDAEDIKRMNPYPVAWRLAKIADWAYEGVRGNGYAGFLADAEAEPFRRTMWRLTKSAARAAVSRGREAAGLTYAPVAA